MIATLGRADELEASGALASLTDLFATLDRPYLVQLPEQPYVFAR
jgi:hypothetical protein